jgi:hypothetical protein
MREGGSLSANELRNGSSAGSLADGAESRLLLSRDYTEVRPSAPQPDSPTRALSREITEHKRQLEQQSWLEQGLSYITEPIHQSSARLSELERLQERARAGSSPELDKEITQAIAADSSATKARSEIGTYGSSMLQTAGLFMGSKKGLAYTALAFGLGAAKPNDSAATQVTDFVMGGSKGVVTGLLFHKTMNSSADVATKALMMGVGGRFADATLSRSTYIDPTSGNLDFGGAAGRIGARTADPGALVMDVAVFGTGQALLQNQSIRNAIQKNAMTATMATAGAFGFAGGAGEEISKQLKTGEFDPLAIVGRGALRSATDAVAAIPGGMNAARVAAGQRETSLGLTRNEGTALRSADPLTAARAIRERYILDKSPLVDRTLSGGSSREFQVVGGDVKALDMLGRSKNAAAVVDVREVGSDGHTVGDTKKMLVQHVDESTPLRSQLASSVDLVASCNPGLCGPATSKHLFGELKGTASVFYTRFRDRLTFSTDQLTARTAGGAIELGSTRTVSDLLLLPETKNYLRTPRPIEKYAKEMQHFKDPASRVIDAGADSIVFELADGRILKMTDRPYRKDGQPLWRPEWGSRTYETESGIHRFDARLLTKPVQIEVNHEPIMYYIQERAQTPVTTDTLLRFHDNINRDGQYVFWDGGASSLGQAQLGYVANKGGGRGVVLLDYDAVRKPGDAPPESQLSPGSDNHWMSRYRADRVDWER